MLLQMFSLLLLALVQWSAAFSFYPSRTVPSSWFQDSSKYLQPIAESEFKDHDDLDIAASEFNNEHIDRMATDLKRGQLERISSGNVETKRDQVAAATGDNHGGRVQIKVYRGPDSGGHHEHFAPYGYWVKQPADYDHH
ncbi:hypothetical protein M8J75_009866 [Diaphorina citri]|nr:hypothetical protein M8J75_009866 [Diaphorina citri]KAI5731322.1 hypothetical protein M8J77_008215 [Diaphorina citri]